jgi:hypothetical protein
MRGPRGVRLRLRAPKPVATNGANRVAPPSTSLPAGRQRIAIGRVSVFQHPDAAAAILHQAAAGGEVQLQTQRRVRITHRNRGGKRICAPRNGRKPPLRFPSVNAAQLDRVERGAHRKLGLQLVENRGALGVLGDGGADESDNEQKRDLRSFHRCVEPLERFPEARAPKAAQAFDIIGAPEEIRTPDPQIRSLVLYPAELRARRGMRRLQPRGGRLDGFARDGKPAPRL